MMCFLPRISVKVGQDAIAQELLYTLRHILLSLSLVKINTSNAF